jgi:acetoin utilization deacetylase AcuC-like enzyme
MSTGTLVLFDDDMIAHDPGPGHPERPGRLRAIASRLSAHPIEGVSLQRPHEADLEDLLRVHTPAHVERIESGRGTDRRLDPDTMMSPGSAHAARLAAGAATEIVDALVGGTARNAFAFVRPPGHHAEPQRAMGFCLYDNVAVAAARAIAVHGLERVLVVDWDVHHGNGTQAIFESRRDVLVFDVHQSPLYPGTGELPEHGRGAGEGFQVNVPLLPGARDGDYTRVFSELLVPIADAFAPQLVLVSAGFDAHAADPLGGMRLSTELFAELCAAVNDIAHRHTGGRLALFLEGGYDLDALAESTHACLQVLAGASSPGVTGATTREGETGLRAAIDHHRRFWRV